MASYMRVDYEAIDWIEYTDLGRYKPPIIVDKLVMTILEWKKGYSPPLHTHEDEQITYVLSGGLEVDLDDEGIKRYEYLTAGQAIAIKAYVPHRLIGIEDGVAVEFWTPGWRHRANEQSLRVGESGVFVPEPPEMAAASASTSHITVETDGHAVKSKSAKKTNKN